jgi:crotonobetainyl-CoA:carnitine CoA-transferase CaiB-like acyl-CoA transferase
MAALSPDRSPDRREVCSMAGPLEPYRVVDLTNHRGQLCGQILGDLGADVILVEPPGGTDTRRIAPFRNGASDPEQSLAFWAWNRNKRSVMLDYEAPHGRDMLLRLIETADFVIESEQPGRMAELGLGYEDVRRVRPDVIYASISAFGQDGPKANWAVTDLMVLAASGPLVLSGDEARPPVRVAVPQGFLHAAADAAGAMLIANHYRARTGWGQHIDLSAQQSAAMATQSMILSVPFGDNELVRAAGGLKLGPLDIRLMWPAKDGFVSITFLFGTAIGPFTRRFMEWMHEEGYCDNEMLNTDWLNFTNLMLADPGRWVPVYERSKQIVENFTKSKTKRELLDGALERHLLIAPVTTTRDVVESEQLASRAYWQLLEHPELGQAFRYPGPFVKFSETPMEYRRRPPLIGEHTREVLVDELGLPLEEIADLQGQEVA